MNTKNLHYKEKLKLEREVRELETEQSKNCRWVILEKPYRNGYLKTYDLREDIKNRSDAWVFYKCLSLTVVDAWSREKTFRKKLRKGNYEIIKPGFRYISEKVYENLHPKVKKYFVEVKHWDSHYNPWRKEYKLSIPNYYLVDKIRPHWITEIYERDFSHESAIAEKWDALYDKERFGSLWGRGSAPSWYCNSFHRSDRRHNKNVLKNIIESEDFEFDRDCFRYDHHHAANWYYW